MFGYPCFKEYELSSRGRYNTKQRMMSEMKANSNHKVNSLERGLDGRIVMNIKDETTLGSNSSRHKKSRLGLSIPKRKKEKETAKFTDSASKYLGQVYQEFVADLDKTDQHQLDEADHKIEIAREKHIARSQSSQNTGKREMSVEDRKSQNQKPGGKGKSKRNRLSHENGERMQHKNIQTNSPNFYENQHFGVIAINNEPAEQSTYIDTQESIRDEKGVNDKDNISNEVFVVSESRRSSLYFDEEDGKFGTWKRIKVEK